MPHRPRAALAALFSLAVVAAPVALAAPASAAATVTPTVDCYQSSSSGVEVVFGYDATSSTNYSHGSQNNVKVVSTSGSSTTDTSSSPTHFSSGSHRGAFSVTAPAGSTSSVTWTVGSATAQITGSNKGSYDTCGSSTSLPAYGNPAALSALVLATGAAAAVLFAVYRRRALRSAALGAPAPTERGGAL